MIDKKELWYFRLLRYSLLIGFVGGVSALLFTWVTNGGSSLLFGDMSSDSWSGSLYWIPLTGFGAFLVTYLRNKLKVPKKVPGAVELAEISWVEPSTAPQLILIATLSIVFGASLGPSFGIVMLGGAFASWLVTKIEPKLDHEKQKEYARAGMAGSLGSVFSAPILATILTIELSVSKLTYVKTILPRLITSSLGYVVFFGATGAVIINAYKLPQYEYSNIHLLYGAVLGLVATIFFILFAVLTKLTEKFMSVLGSGYTKSIIGGLAIGTITYALPLTFSSGNSQLATVTSQYATFSILLLFAIFAAKTVALKLSQESGFIGGNVFPILFISGVAGVIVHLIVPDIPVALTVGAMMASIPGAALSAPISLILIAVGSLGQSTAIIPPITMAVVVTQISMYVINDIITKKKTVSA